MNQKALLVGTASALSCLLLKDNKKNQCNQLKLPSFPNIVEVRSAIKGRIRLYIPLLKDNAMLSEQVLKEFEGIPVIKEVKINTKIATLLMIYNEDKVQPHILEGAVIKLLGLDATIHQEEKSVLEREFRTIINAVNKGVFEKTKGFMDAKYLLVIWLLIISVLKFIQNPETPLNPFSLLWWSTNIALRGKSYD